MSVPCEAETGALTVYVYPPYGRLDWSTPRSLWSSFLHASRKTGWMDDRAIETISDSGEANRLSSRYSTPLGHTITRVQCRRTSGEWLDRWTSLSGMDDGWIVFRNTVLNGLGAGVMTYQYRDGHILTGEENWKRLVYYTNENAQSHPRYIRFLIDPAACDRVCEMIAFYSSFHWPAGTGYSDLEKRDPEDVIFFAPDYLPFESYRARMETGHGTVGGGCAGWGAGLVKAAGQYDPLFDELWMRSITISERLFGGTRNTFGLRRHVSIPQILWGKLGRSWIHSGASCRTMRYWEPTLMWDFIGEALSCLNSGRTCDSKVAEWLAGDDRRVVKGPTEVFWDSGLGANGEKVLRNSPPIEGLVVNRSRS